MDEIQIKPYKQKLSSLTRVRTYVRTNHKIQKHRNQIKNRSNIQTAAANYRSLTSNTHLNNHAFRGF